MTTLTPHYRTALIYRHNGELAPLLLGLLPSLEDARQRGLVSGAAWQRHWLRGPHLKLHFQVVLGQEDELRALIERRAAAVFGDLPAPAPGDALTPQAYRQRYAPVAAVELVADDLSDLRPDHSVAWEALSLRAEMYGSADLTALARDFLFESHDLFSGYLQACAGAPRSALLALAAQLMLAFPQGFQNPQETSSCFRSHAEGFLHSFQGKTPLREQFLARQRAAAPELRRALARALDPDPALRRWTELIGRTAQRAEASFARGVRLPGVQDYLRLEAQLPDEVRPASSTFKGYSPLHQPLNHPDSAASQLYRSVPVQARRFAVNLLYERLTALGLTPGERYLLCYLVAHTTEEHYQGSDWWSRVQRQSETAS